MASAARTTITWSRNRGRNGWDIPSDLPEDMVAEAIDVVLVKNTLGQKRQGTATQAITGTFTSYYALARYVPGQSEAAAELFIVSNDGTPKIGRVAAGTAFTDLTLADNIATKPQDAHFAVLNGKLFIAYDSAVNRLHVFDPNTSTSAVRRSGLAAPAAATVADLGAGSGSYAATLRYYRIQWVTQVSSTDRIYSNLGTAVSFTPVGNGTHARVTRPSLAGESETHWRVWGSEDGELYYRISGAIAVATTTFDDNTAPASYADVFDEAAPEEGAFTPWPSVKFLLSTGDRLVGFGVWESSAGTGLAPKNGRVYFSPVLDTTDVDDEERVSDTVTISGYIDVGRNAGAEDRAIAGPLDGQILVFQSRGLHMLISTGEADQPFRRITLSPRIGAVNQWSTFVGEDEAGRACIYWLDPERGPYRYGAEGLQWCGYDIQDIWRTVNLAATTRVAHGVYDPELRRCLFWLATGSSNAPNEAVQFFVREGEPTKVEGVRYGWARMTCADAPISSVVFSETIGATMSHTLKAYTGATILARINDDSATTDPSSTSFRGYVTSRAFPLRPLHVNKTLGKSYLQAAVATNVTIRQTLTRNYGDEPDRHADASITPQQSETRRLVRFEDANLAEAFTFQVTLGDAVEKDSGWTLDEWTATVETKEERG